MGETRRLLSRLHPIHTSLPTDDDDDDGDDDYDDDDDDAKEDCCLDYIPYTPHYQPNVFSSATQSGK